MKAGSKMTHLQAKDAREGQRHWKEGAWARWLSRHSRALTSDLEPPELGEGRVPLFQSPRLIHTGVAPADSTRRKQIRPIK